MQLVPLPEVVKNAALPLAQTDKIVMYGDGNSTRLMKDVMGSSNQIMEALRESTGLDITELISRVAGKIGGTETAGAPEAPAKEE